MGGWCDVIIAINTEIEWWKATELYPQEFPRNSRIFKSKKVGSNDEG